MREVRLAALLEAPHAFASSHGRERADTDDLWRQRLRERAWFVAGNGVGLAAGSASYDGLVDRRDLTSMWVHPGGRGRRVAGLLVVAVRGWAAADGARELALWVVDGNAAAERAYARAGFAPTGRRQSLPGNPAVDEAQWVLGPLP